VPLLVVQVNSACITVGIANSSSSGTSSNVVRQAVLAAGNRFWDAPPGRENWFLVALMCSLLSRMLPGARGRSQAGSFFLAARSWNAVAGWRGTGLTPLWMAWGGPKRKRCVPSPLTHRTPERWRAGSHAAHRRSSSASSMIFTPSFRALSCLEPASAPAKT
jgi:hypothetical protein